MIVSTSQSTAFIEELKKVANEMDISLYNLLIKAGIITPGICFSRWDKGNFKEGEIASVVEAVKRLRKSDFERPQEDPAPMPYPSPRSSLSDESRKLRMKARGAVLTFFKEHPDCDGPDLCRATGTNSGTLHWLKVGKIDSVGDAKAEQILNALTSLPADFKSDKDERRRKKSEKLRLHHRSRRTSVVTALKQKVLDYMGKEHLSYEEIAKKVHVPASTFHSWMKRGVKRQRNSKNREQFQALLSLVGAELPRRSYYKPRTSVVLPEPISLSAQALRHLEDMQQVASRNHLLPIVDALRKSGLSEEKQEKMLRCLFSL